MKDYYKKLGVSKTATEKEIKSAYRKLMKETHPDYHPDDKDSEERAKEINEAYSILGDEKKRREYDFMLNQGTSTQSSFQSGVGSQPFGNFDFGNLFSSFDSPIFDFSSPFFDLGTGFGYNLEVEFDKFMSYLEELDKESVKYGVTTKKYRESLRSRRGKMSVRDIARAKLDAEQNLEKLKRRAEKFDEFNNRYNQYKQELERQGRSLTGDFSKYLDPTNRCKIDIEELQNALTELNSSYYSEKKIINERIYSIVSKFTKFGISLSNLLAERRILITSSIGEEEIENLEKMANLLGDIDTKLRPLNMSLNSVFMSLKIQKSKLSLPVIELINKNIDEELTKGMFAKRRITHMSIEIPEEAPSPKM